MNQPSVPGDLSQGIRELRGTRIQALLVLHTARHIMRVLKNIKSVISLQICRQVAFASSETIETQRATVTRT